MSKTKFFFLFLFICIFQFFPSVQPEVENYEVHKDKTNEDLQQVQTEKIQKKSNLYPTLNLEIPQNSLINRYIEQYTSKFGIDYLNTVMQRSLPYRRFIEEEIIRQAVPDWLIYLPIIESSYSVTAVSKSGATGIWQFMKNSIGGYGIRINDWMDERRDPWLSSVAALKKLKENYMDLGDWYLALAAYNCGLGATRIAIKKGGKADFWYLSEKGFFKEETVHYVPKFIAVSTILSKSDTYGISWGEIDTTIEFATIPVKKAIDLHILSKETNIDVDILKQANPALFYYITPPENQYALRVPLSSYEQVQTALKDPTKSFLEYYIYKIKSGDTLFALSKHYGISVGLIEQYNPGIQAHKLQLGQTVLIPAFKTVSTYLGKKDPDNLIFNGSYLVKKGDSLWSIALAYGIQVETLAEKNNMNVNDVLRLGKQLRVPIL